MPPNTLSLGGAGFRRGGATGGQRHRENFARRNNEHNDAAKRSVFWRRGLSPRRKKKGIGKPIRGFPMPFLRTTSAPRRHRGIQLPFGISASRNFCNPCLHRAAAGLYNCHSVLPPVIILQTLFALRVIPILFATPINSERSLFAFCLSLVLPSYFSQFPSAPT